MDDVRAYRIEYAVRPSTCNAYTEERSSERDSQRWGFRTVNDISFITVSNVNTVNSEVESCQLKSKSNNIIISLYRAHNTSGEHFSFSHFLDRSRSFNRNHIKMQP